MFTRFLLFSTTLATISASPAPAAGPGDDLLRTVHRVTVRSDSARLAAGIAEAERFAAAGRMADARRAYRKIISQELEEGEYPSAAMWQLANAYYGDGNERDAARELDRLADAASTFGDPEMELRARFEAAVIYARHREPERVATHIQRVRALLKSPVIDERTRQSISARLVN